MDCFQDAHGESCRCESDGPGAIFQGGENRGRSQCASALWRRPEQPRRIRTVYVADRSPGHHGIHAAPTRVRYVLLPTTRSRVEIIPPGTKCCLIFRYLSFTCNLLGWHEWQQHPELPLHPEAERRRERQRYRRPAMDRPLFWKGFIMWEETLADFGHHAERYQHLQG